MESTLESAIEDIKQLKQELKRYKEGARKIKDILIWLKQFEESE